MPKIFINYRRGGTAGHAGRLFDRMQQDFGSANVFMDVTTIKPGADFAKEIESAVGACDVLIVVIGRDWVGCVDGQSRRRLLRPNDFVRREVAAALLRGVCVVPVLVQRAELPDEDDLPVDLKPLAQRQAFELRDARWDNDVASLSEAIRSITTPKLTRTTLSKGQRVLVAGAAFAFPVSVVLAWSVATRTPTFANKGVPEPYGTPPATPKLETAPQPPPPPAPPVAPRVMERAPLAPASATRATSRPGWPSDRHERGVSLTAKVETIGSSTAPHSDPVNTSAPATDSHAVSAAAEEDVQPSATMPATPTAPSPPLAAPGAPISPWPCGPVPPWTPVPEPKRSLANRVFGRDSSFEARMALLRTGPPCRSVAASTRALQEHKLTARQHADFVWALNQLREHRLKIEKNNLSNGFIGRADYDARVTAIEAAYQGR